MADGQYDITESWPEYRRLVLAELERLNKAIVNLDDKLAARENNSHREMAILQNDVLSLKVKASIWGGITGAVGSAIVTLVATFIYRSHS